MHIKRLLPAALLCAALLAPTTLEARKQKKNAEIPILAWYSIPGGKFATEEHYRELKDCGFNYSFSHSRNFDDGLKALDLCKKVGIKSIFTCPELHKEPEAIVRRVRRHAGLGGYFLRDEPQNADLPELGKWARRIESVDTEHPCYLNLFPLQVFGHEGYGEHLRLFNEQVDLPQISFDHYPLLARGDSVIVRKEYYDNLEMISAEAKRTGKPFWAFALATAHQLADGGYTVYPVPTMGHLRLQMYSNLAYGAQALQYFTYWNPGTETWDFHKAPITQRGRRSQVYEKVRTLNQELQRRAQVFMGCRVQEVLHLGDSIPEGTRRMETPPPHFLRLDSRGQAALVSHLTNQGRHYIIVQNTNPNRPICIDIGPDEQVMRLRPDGTSTPAHRYEPEHYLEPGMVEVFYY